MTDTDDGRSPPAADAPAPGAPPDTVSPPPGDTGPPPGPPAPRSVRLRTILIWTATVAVAATAGIAIGGRDDGPTHGAAAPEIVPGADGGEEAPARYYTCGMHPWVLLPRPGSCPICGMDLVPVDPAKFTGQVSINPIVAQNIGVRIEPVVSRPAAQTVRTVGTVEYDERRVRTVNTKFAGWIEKLHVDFVGAEVKAGQPLFTVYAPELYAAQRELLLANPGGANPGASKGLLAAARKKLEYFDISPRQIEELERDGEPRKTMTIRSPHTGIVAEKHAFEGMRFDPGMQMYRIADLRKVWVMVTLYEYQLPQLREGQKARMTLSYVPGKTFEGTVIYVYPYLDRKSRHVQVRLEFDNPDQALKPGMFATVELESALTGERTVAPRAAVIDTGERKVAFVSAGEGRFEPRDVRTGIETLDGHVEILEGLEPGELVVTSGQFLLDSEANVREALAKMIKGDLASEQRPKAPAAGQSELRELPAPAQEALSRALAAALRVSDRLASDSTDGLAQDARALADAAASLASIPIPEAPHFWHEHEEVRTVQADALALAKGAPIDETRRGFAHLSAALAALVRATGIPPGFGQELQELHCPMYEGGSVWLQPPGPVRNPYYGAQMLACYDTRSTLPVTGGAPAGEGRATP